MKLDERGSATIWLLGLSLVLLLFGGLALDFWRGLALQRELAAVADSAVIAAASGIDEGVYRETGVVALDPSRARALAMASIGFQGVRLTSTRIEVSPAGEDVTVTIEGAVELGLLGVLVDESDPLTVSATATARPLLVP